MVRAGSGAVGKRSPKRSIRATEKRVNELLAICPQELRENLKRVARKAVNGPQQRKAAMRIKCLECTNWQTAEVARCEITGCSLWEFR